MLEQEQEIIYYKVFPPEVHLKEHREVVWLEMKSLEQLYFVNEVDHVGLISATERAGLAVQVADAGAVVWKLFVSLDSSCSWWDPCGLTTTRELMNRHCI